MTRVSKTLARLTIRGSQRNSFAGKVVRVALAVPSFVVPQRYIVGNCPAVRWAALPRGCGRRLPCAAPPQFAPLPAPMCRTCEGSASGTPILPMSCIGRRTGSAPPLRPTGPFPLAIIAHARSPRLMCPDAPGRVVLPVFRRYREPNDRVQVSPLDLILEEYIMYCHSSHRRERRNRSHPRRSAQWHRLAAPGAYAIGESQHADALAVRRTLKRHCPACSPSDTRSPRWRRGRCGTARPVADRSCRAD